MWKYKFALALGLLCTGTFNVLAAKAVSSMESMGRDGMVKPFLHPFLQAWGMFLGEIGCMIVYLLQDCRRIQRRKIPDPEAMPALESQSHDGKPFNPWTFCPPALLDVTATCIAYFGLTLTYASSYQMLKGSVIIFTALLSQFALGKHVSKTRWFGIFVIILGLTTVGVTDLLNSKREIVTLISTKENTNLLADLFPGQDSTPTTQLEFYDVLMGDCLVIGAQILVSIQVVYEEKFIKEYDVDALHVVGLEGIFGFTAMSVLLVPMYFIKVGEKFGKNPNQVMEDPLDGFHQLGHNPGLLTLFIMNFISISLYYYVAISITKAANSTYRVILDSVRTLIVWGISLAFKWQSFHVLHLFGFFFLILGICIYNELINFSQCLKSVCRCCPGQTDPELLSTLTTNSDFLPKNEK
jgi:drug/metabolite transporter (DMT)-like permease